jgi:hypothetical protein
LLSPPHSVWTEAIAAFGLRLSGLSQWGPYLVNSIFLSILFLYFVKQFCKTNLIATLIATLIILSPLGYIAFDQFRPDITYTLVLTIGVKKLLLTKESLETDLFFKTLIYTIFFLVLVKPTWFAFTGIFLGIILMKYVLLWKKKDHPRFIKYFLILFVEVALLSLWYWDHIYRYVFQWALSENGATKLMSGPAAIKESVLNAVAYIGVRNTIVLTALVTFALVRILIEKKDFKTHLKQLSFILFMPLIMSLPVLISGMPSPFQGLLWIIPVVFLLLGIYGEVIEKRGKSYEALVVTLISLLMFSATPLTKVGSSTEVSKPIFAVEKVAEGLVEDCLTFNICDNKYPSARAPQVGMLAFGELSPEAVEYYSLVRGVQLFPQLLDRDTPLALNATLNIANLDYLITYGKPSSTSMNDNWLGDNLYLLEQNWKVVGNSQNAFFIIWRNSKYVD